MKPEFIEIDQKNWARAESFYYYTQMAPTTYTVNVSLDVTRMRAGLKEKHLRFFPMYLYLVTKQLIRQKEFCIAKQGNELGYWKTLTPAYPQFHEDDHTTSLLWTEYKEDFRSFYEAYITDRSTYGDSHGIIGAKGVPPANSYIISCIPWFTFDSFSLHNHGIKDYYLPSFEAGGFREENGKIMMPLSITVHHATVDGYQIKVFLEELQHSIDHWQDYIS